MNLMNKKNYHADFYIGEDDEKQLCHLSISEPETNDEDDNFCRVQLTPLLKNEKRIIGIDESQAKQLAIDFVKSLLNGKELTDTDGNKINISDIIK